MSWLDLVDVKDSKGKFEAMPIDDYALIIDEVISDKSETGNPYVKLMLKVATGEFKGRKLRFFLNIFHPNQDVKKRSNEALARILNTIGVPEKDRKFGSFEALHDTLISQVVAARVKVQKDNKDYNDIHYFIAADEAKIREIVEANKLGKTGASKKKKAPINLDEIPF